ncbi:MAG: hypothetical protein ABEJ07_00810 [Candidatus Nanohaloarchaea archaeon]
MLPEKHLKDLESSRKRRKILSHVTVSATFLASFLLIGQFIHELFHVLPLWLIGCPYSTEIGFSFVGGAHAIVRPLCTPSDGFLLVFYSLGYLSTLVAGWGAIVAASRLKSFRANTLAAAGTGMLMSILLTIGSEGDVESFLSVAEVSRSWALPVSLAFILVVLAVSLSGVEMLAGQNGRKATLTNP